MKRIIAITVALIMLAGLTAALDDFSPTGGTIITNQGITFDPVCSQAAAGVSQLITKTDLIQQSCDASFKRSDLSTFETAIDEKFERKIGDILAKMLTILLVYFAFEKAITFLMISRGWLGYGYKKTEEPKRKQVKELPTIEKKPEETKTEPAERPLDPIDEMVNDIIPEEKEGMPNEQPRNQRPAQNENHRNNDEL